MFASGWPKTTEQIVELPWFQSKYIVFFFKFILIDYCLNEFCCHLVVLMDWCWDCLHRCVGNLLLMSKPAAIELGFAVEI